MQDIEKIIKIYLKKGVSEGVFPGAVAGLLIDRNGKLKTIVCAEGHTDLSREFITTNKTYYDLASITKPFVTSLSLLFLLKEKGIRLTTPISELLQRDLFLENINITIEQLLHHRSGLPAYRPYYDELKTIKSEQERKKKIIEMILGEPLNIQKEKEAVYSDLGFILLGHVIEELSGIDLNEYWSTHIASPLSLEGDLCFKPLERGILKQNIAPTEECPKTKKMLCGEVHDENCRYLGGVSGHAGLFGNIAGVLKLCHVILQCWRGDLKCRIDAEMMKRKFCDYKRDSGWVFGFDTPSASQSSSGRFFSKSSIGHLGFTGTSFWIDLEKGITIVLLTNRVHPSRNNEKIKIFRPIFHDAIMEKLIEN